MIVTSHLLAYLALFPLIIPFRLFCLIFREKHDINDLNVKLAEYIESNGWYRIKVKEQEKLIIKMKGKQLFSYDLAINHRVINH